MRKYYVLFIIGLFLIPAFNVWAAQKPVKSPLIEKMKGKILLQVESQGESWYVTPAGERYFLGNPETAFKVLKELGLGISNKDIAQIPISSKSLDPKKVEPTRNFKIEYEQLYQRVVQSQEMIDYCAKTLETSISSEKYNEMLNMNKRLLNRLDEQQNDFDGRINTYEALVNAYQKKINLMEGYQNYLNQY